MVNVQFSESRGGSDLCQRWPYRHLFSVPNHGHLGVHLEMDEPGPCHKRLDAPAQFGAAASLAAILRPSSPGAPWKCCEMACENR